LMSQRLTMGLTAFVLVCRISYVSELIINVP
jgi:hypothetical protein